ncbi:MAG: ABC transporter substrate-binding protein [Chloroflexia bacterium]
MRSRLIFTSMSVFAGLSMLLTGCGGNPTDTPAPPTATSGTTAAPTAMSTSAMPAATGTAGTAMTPAMSGTAVMSSTPAVSGGGAAGTPSVPAGPPTSTPKPGEKIARFDNTQEPDTTDPQKMSFVYEISWGDMNWQALYELNDQGVPVPAAAAGPPTLSADGSKYTVTLKDGLKYSDGQPLTAHNFEYAFRRLFDPRIPGRDYASIAYDIKGAADLDAFTALTDTTKLKSLQDAFGVHATDDKHIEFQLNGPAAYFPYVLAIWVGWPSRQDLVEKGGDKWTEPATYIGNGPYILTEWNHGSGAVWEANPNFSKGKPKIDRIEFREITDSAVRFQAYKAGELDSYNVAPEDLKAVKNDPVLSKEYKRYPGTCNFYIGFNTLRPPFDNIKVRKAFSQAFDRQDYVDVVLKGAGQPALSFIPPGRPGYEADVKQPDFNADAAKSALAAAGFPNGQGLPPIKLTYNATPRNKTRMEWIQGQMKTNLGIDMALDPVETTAYTALTKKPETTPQMFFLGWCQDYPDPQDWLSLVFRSDSTVQHTSWKNAQFDTLTTQADHEADQTKRLADYKQAQQILAAEAPVVFLYWDVNDILIKPYLKGMAEHITGQDATNTVPGIDNIQNMDIVK